MKQEHIDEIKGIVILAFSAIILASLVSFVPEDLSWYTSQPNIPPQNWIKIIGAYLSGALLFVIGYSSYFLVVFFAFWAWNKFSHREIHFTFSKFISFIVLFSVVSALLSITGPQEVSTRFIRSGFVGMMLSDFLIYYLGLVGTYIVLCALGALALILTGELLLTPVMVTCWDGACEIFGHMRQKWQKQNFSFGSLTSSVSNKKKTTQSPKKTSKRFVEEDEDEEEYEEDEEYEEEYDEQDYEEEDDEEYEDEEEEDEDVNQEPAPVKNVGKPKIKVIENQKSDEPEEDMPLIVGDYHMPSMDLLQDAPQISSSKIQNTLMNRAKLLEETLASFSVQARVADIERGPAITRFELEPGPGVKVQKFTTLSDDIALAMKASTVRIVAPIPGKNRVGIEVPNAASAAVNLKDVLTSSEFRNSKSKLTLALGKDISGKAMVADLAEMPHLLIAGTTGSGKSVCVNGIVMSVIMNATPDEVKFVMIDPKMVELAVYNDLPHLLCPTVTDTKKASNALNWVVGEMENRYKKLSKERVRNIKAYHAKGLHMPYIIVIIDELADLMQVSAKTVEGSIARLAQLSRAVGIHLILATQRPSVDVITGVIKANFPARISFKVASKVDSRTVLDANGAENLLGKGDMLFIQPGDAKPSRGQGNFVTDEEIHGVVDFIKNQQEPVYNETIIKQQTSSGVGGSQEKDEYFDQAVRLVIETNQASVSILQRRLRLGYTRAARLVDMMEQEGIVGPYVGSKARDILVDREQWLLDNMEEGNQEDEQE